MVNIKFNDAAMIVEPKGLHKFWALKSKLQIPLDQVTCAKMHTNERPLFWRVPGTYLPFIITAGTYRNKGKKVFWDVVRKGRAIVINLKNNPYKQLVVEVDQPIHMVNQINAKRAYALN